MKGYKRAVRPHHKQEHSSDWVVEYRAEANGILKHILEIRPLYSFTNFVTESASLKPLLFDEYHGVNLYWHTWYFWQNLGDREEDLRTCKYSEKSWIYFRLKIHWSDKRLDTGLEMFAKDWDLILSKFLEMLHHSWFM